MKILTTILFTLLLTTYLKAENGFYIGVSTGVTINNDITFKDLNRVSSYNETTNEYSESTIESGLDGAYTKITNDITTNNTYSAILKEITYKKSASKPVFSLNAGFYFKNIRIEGELRRVSLKITPKNYIYDVNVLSDYTNIVGTLCHNSSSSNNTTLCTINGEDVEDTWIYTTINGNSERNLNNIYVNSSSSTIFSTNIDKNLFSANDNPLNIDSYVGFTNILYELPITNNFTFFTGIGLGYGTSFLKNDLISKQKISYPAYQYKVGLYYSISRHMDVIINYADINMMGSVKRIKSPTPFTIKDTNFQFVELGLRYNFFEKNVESKKYNYKNIYEEYSYENIYKK